MLDSISYDIKTILKSHFGMKTVGCYHICMTLKASLRNVSRKSVNH